MTDVAEHTDDTWGARAGGVLGGKRVCAAGLLLLMASCVLLTLAVADGVAIAGKVIHGTSRAAIRACRFGLLSTFRAGLACLVPRSGYGEQLIGKRRPPMPSRSAIVISCHSVSVCVR